MQRLFIIFFTLSCFNLLHAGKNCTSCKAKKAALSDTETPTEDNITHFNVTGMTCKGCVKSLTSTLSAIKGVEVKKICHKSGCVDVVLSEEATKKQVEDAILKKGYKIVPTKKESE